MAYSDKHGTFFARPIDAQTVAVLHIEDGEAATRLDASVYPVGSDLSARYEHPDGITLSIHDATAIGLDIEGWT